MSQQDIGGDGASLGDASDSAQSADDSGAASAASYAMRDLLLQRGYALPDDVNDDQILDQLSQWSDQADKFSELAGDQDADQLRQYIDAGRQFMSEREKYNEWKRSVGQSAPQSVPQQPVASAPTPAPQAAQSQANTPTQPNEETIQLWQQVCTFDEEKQCYVPKGQGFEQAASGLNNLMLQRRRNLERFSLDPEGFIRQQSEAYIQQELERRMSEYQQKITPDLEAWRAYQQQQIVDNFIAPFRAELVNEQGDLLPKGQVFEQAFAKLPESMDFKERLQLARNEADLWATRNAGAQSVGAGKSLFTLKKATPQAQVTQQTPATSQQPVAQPNKRQAFVDQGRQPRDPQGRFLRTADQSGTVTNAQRQGVPQYGNPGFKQLYEQARRRGGPAT